MGLLHRDCAHWSRYQIVCCCCCWHHLVGSTVELFQSFALHLQLHLGILFEDLRVALAKHLSHPLVGYSSGAQPCGIRGAEVVNPKIGNLCPSKSFSPNSFERGLVPARNPIARKQKRTFISDRHLIFERFDSDRGEGDLGDTVRGLRIRYPGVRRCRGRAFRVVGRGRYTPGKAFGSMSQRGLVQRYDTLPWIPTEDEWRSILAVVQTKPTRVRLMFALGYDAALRREELCSIETADIDTAHRTVRIRAEVTKNRLERVVPYSIHTNFLYQQYLGERRHLGTGRGLLFLSSSRRNHGKPLSFWMWSKTVRGLAIESGVSRLTTHTLRHLRLTDLARAGWDVHEIATFAGHRSIQTTLGYIHLSGHELAEKLERTLAEVDVQRLSILRGEPR